MLTRRTDPSTRHAPICARTGGLTLVSRQRLGEAGGDGSREKPVTCDPRRRSYATFPDKRTRQTVGFLSGDYRKTIFAMGPVPMYPA